MLKKISDIIVDTARQEDSILKKVGKGIFQIPELAFAYSVGREIAINAETIFGNTNICWLPEETIATNSGRTDLVFTNPESKGLAVEFKIGGHADSYRRDIDKLCNIDDIKYERIFCALIDAWPNKLTNDPRILAVEETNRTTRLCRDDFFDFFATLHEKYKSQLCCVVGVWHIK